jgi:tetratricopeptide (TPR) repeat protein
MFGIDLADQTLQIGARRFRPSRKFFHLYCLLALRCLQNRDAGYVDADEIRKLPHWQKTNQTSVGGEVWRHIKQQEKRNLNVINAARRSVGPYYLKVAHSDIVIKGPIEDLHKATGLIETLAAVSNSTDQVFATLIRHMCNGYENFEGGEIDQAEVEYKAASELGASPRQKAFSCAQIGRMQERMGKYGLAEKAYDAAVKDSALDTNDFIRCYISNLRAWLKYREGKLKEAERLYLEALDKSADKWNEQLLGDIYNGLGEISFARQEYAQATMYYKRAVLSWIMSGYYYGIQAALCNLAQANVRRGDEISNTSPRIAYDSYRSAQQTVTLAIDICRKFGVGLESNDNNIVLSEALLRLGRADDSWK